MDSIAQLETLMCPSPIRTEKHETARRLAQLLKIVYQIWRWANNFYFGSGADGRSCQLSAALRTKLLLTITWMTFGKAISNVLDRVFGLLTRRHDLGAWCCRSVLQLNQPSTKGH